MAFKHNPTLCKCDRVDHSQAVLQNANMYHTILKSMEGGGGGLFRFAIPWRFPVTTIKVGQAGQEILDFVRTDRWTFSEIL